MSQNKLLNLSSGREQLFNCPRLALMKNQIQLSSVEEKLGNEVIISEGVRGVSKKRPVQLTASQVVAIEHLLGLTISKQCRIIYSRFVANHLLYASVDYVRSKRQVNCNVSSGGSSSRMVFTMVGFCT